MKKNEIKIRKDQTKASSKLPKFGSRGLLVKIKPEQEPPMLAGIKIDPCHSHSASHSNKDRKEHSWHPPLVGKNVNRKAELFTPNKRPPKPSGK